MKRPEEMSLWTFVELVVGHVYDRHGIHLDDETKTKLLIRLYKKQCIRISITVNPDQTWRVKLKKVRNHDEDVSLKVKNGAPF